MGHSDTPNSSPAPDVAPSEPPAPQATSPADGGDEQASAGEANLCTDPHVAACTKCLLNMEEPIYLVRVDGGCDAAYLCTDCKNTWQIAWGCGDHVV